MASGSCRRAQHDEKPARAVQKGDTEEGAAPSAGAAAHRQPTAREQPLDPHLSAQLVARQPSNKDEAVSEPATAGRRRRGSCVGVEAGGELRSERAGQRWP